MMRRSILSFLSSTSRHGAAVVIVSSDSLLHSRPISGVVCDMKISSNGGISRQFNHILQSSNSKAFFTTDSAVSNDEYAESTKDLHEKICALIKQKAAVPRALVWSLINSCANEEDIDILFRTLESVRILRLSSLRISDNFNRYLCERVAKACADAKAFDHGLKTLWKHNKYGFTQSIISAHHLLRSAEERNDWKLMRRVVRTIQENDMPLQPHTAELVFRICYNINNWYLILIYIKIFLDSGVRLHRSTFDIWMEFAANRGDVLSIWKAEERYSKTIKQRSSSSAFSCAKGFLLEGKPENAAAKIHSLDQCLPDHKKPEIEKEFQKLIGVWPSRVLKQTKDDKEELRSSLKKDIPAMLDALTGLGLQVAVNMDELNEALGV